MDDITDFSALVFSCDAGNSAGFAKDIETTISGIASILIKTVKFDSRYVGIVEKLRVFEFYAWVKLKFLFSHKFSNRDKALLHIQDTHYG